jgi:hypothetical protein
MSALAQDTSRHFRKVTSWGWPIHSIVWQAERNTRKHSAG